MPELPQPAGAVFISYASEDKEAAARICEALRAVEVEVWFDRNELRGGDAWDAQIKKHIHDCALFMPVISAQTNARSEGYFRREWKLATRRLLDLADDTAFLVPVVIDETRGPNARVPEEFLGGSGPGWRRRDSAGVCPAGAPVAGGSGPPRSSAAVPGRTEPGVRSAPSRGPRSWLYGGRGKRRTRGIGLAVVALLLILGGRVLVVTSARATRRLRSQYPPRRQP